MQHMNNKQQERGRERGELGGGGGGGVSEPGRNRTGTKTQEKGIWG